MKIARIVSLLVTCAIVTFILLSVVSTDKAAKNALKDDPQYKAHREMLIRAGVNPDDPKAVEAYMLKMADDIKKQTEIPDSALKE